MPRAALRLAAGPGLLPDASRSSPRCGGSTRGAKELDAGGWVWLQALQDVLGQAGFGKPSADSAVN